MVIYNTIKRGLSFALISAVLFTSCQKNSDRLYIHERDVLLTEFEPVDRDFEEIKNSGVLRMITYYSSNTYFLNQGIEVGFEYELLREFARENDLALEVIIVGADENPFDLLNQGVGDVIAANYTVTPERRRVVNFTRPYNIVDQMIVYSTGERNRPATLEKLSETGIPISVRRNSSYHYRLLDLVDDGYDVNLNIISEGMDTEATLVQVANGNIRATVADDNMFHAANRYMDGLIPGPVISKSDTIAWAIRKNAPELETRMNRYLYKHFRLSEDRDEPRRSTFLNILRRKYFEESRQMAEYYNPEWQYQSIGIISPYDDMVKAIAESKELDWLLITAIIAQESSFNPYSKSWAGAVGLMQIIPRFVEVPYEELYDPLTNIQVGTQILREHLNHYAYLDSTNQLSFALATYNVGLGHMADARRLAIDRNRNPNEWSDVSEALLMLMQRRYYQDARFGFARGIEPVRYVEEILNRYRTYETIIALAEQQQNGGFTQIFTPGTNRRP